MPIFMVVTAASFAPVLTLGHGRSRRGFRFSLAGLLCYSTMIAVFVVGNVPINQATLAATVDTAGATDFTAMRARWNRLHLLRNALNLAGLTCVIVANLRERA